jgi:hypothetical protein
MSHVERRHFVSAFRLLYYQLRLDPAKQICQALTRIRVGAPSGHRQASQPARGN